MERIYFLARLGTSNYMAHGCTWAHKVTEHIERLSISYGTPAHLIGTISTDKSTTVKNKINKELRKHQVTTSLLKIDTVEPVLEIMSKYDGKTIDPTYVPPEPEPKLEPINLDLDELGNLILD